jgi:hypothetical protein
MAGVFTSRPALDLLWGYEDTLLQLLVTLLPPGSLADGSKVCDMGLLINIAPDVKLIPTSPVGQCSIAVCVTDEVCMVLLIWLVFIG